MRVKVLAQFPKGSSGLWQYDNSSFEAKKRRGCSVSLYTIMTLLLIVASSNLPAQIGEHLSPSRKASDEVSARANAQAQLFKTCIATGSNSSGVVIKPPVTTGRHQVDLSWNPSSSLGVMKYNVHRCDRAGTCALIASVSGTTYSDKQPQASQAYCYFVTASTRNGLESPPSNVIQLVVPSP